MSKQLALALHTFSLVAQILFLWSPPFHGRRSFAVLTIVSLAVAVHFAGPTSDIPGDAQPFALLWPIYLGTLDKIICATGNGPEDSYWRVDRPAREARGMPVYGISKMKWAAAMMFNTRGVRWNYEVKNLPPKPEVTKSTFLLRQSFNFVKMLFMTDILLQLSVRLLWTPPNATLRDSEGKFLDSKHLTITHPDWRWSFLRTLVFAGGPYFFVSLQYVTASIVAVGLNLSRVEDWPSYFGNVGKVTTVRHFWGTFWHQTLRRSLTKFTGGVVDYLTIPRGSMLSSYTQIWLAFFASGFMHAQSMLLLPHPPNVTVWESTAGVMAFFLWQAAAITLEDFVQWLFKPYLVGRDASNSLIRKLVGYLWVTASFWMSLPWAADVMTRLRLTEESFLGFSVFRGLIGNIPVPS